MIYTIIKDTGWTWHYVLWKIAWINVQMMLADAPRYDGKKKDNKKHVDNDDELKAFIGL